MTVPTDSTLRTQQMRESLDITRPLKRAVIKEELVALTGDVPKALLLNQFLYWSERVKDFDQFIQEEKIRSREIGEEATMEPTQGWIYKTAEALAAETMLGFSKTAIGKHIKCLIEAGWIEQRRNPKNKMDKTYQYRVNIVQVQWDLLKLGYSLEGYRIPIELIVEVTTGVLPNADFSPAQVESHRSKQNGLRSPYSLLRSNENGLASAESGFRSEESGLPSNESGQQYHRLHTEITTETISENTYTEQQTYTSTNIPPKRKEEHVVVPKQQILEMVKRVEQELRTSIQSLIPLFPTWIQQYGEDYIIQRAAYVRQYATTNPVGAFRKAMEEGWSVSRPSVTDADQRDKRYENFYKLFPNG